MDFANQIVARYDDIFRLVDGRWLFERRTEVVVPYRRRRAADVGDGAWRSAARRCAPLPTDEDGASE